MTTLATQFRSDGFNFTQIKRLGDTAIFAKRRDNWDADCATYEVVRIKRVPDIEIFGKLVAAHEAMPPSSAWGTKGWSYSHLDAARGRFSQLTDQNA